MFFFGVCFYIFTIPGNIHRFSAIASPALWALSRHSCLVELVVQRGLIARTEPTYTQREHA